jgi:hypothetical protein
VIANIVIRLRYSAARPAPVAVHPAELRQTRAAAIVGKHLKIELIDNMPR